jgi:hypothetical protein
MISERKEYLKQYVLACVRDSQLTLNDLLGIGALEKLTKVISRDAKAVFVELRQTGGAGVVRMAEPFAVGALRMGASWLESVLVGKRQK